ncbi:heavy metal translocating P-type ATPase [Sediminibacterium ginsengisoli]|uniref:P-type Zn(2+) transporter n=1 Tax=Sediminibacterium ginsengisoli TaxID=413434 RepID=A0A1T4P212_9BACT|nr:cation-translocating P-type ATPase [Sediminibacterium ginsengisoli]SJZ85523.1 Cd2+/Zn2+-exporting ATPase [Sediminibacterium ginsengisoli]
MSKSTELLPMEFLWEFIRIIIVALFGVVYYEHIISPEILLWGVAFGLYALIKTGIKGLVRKRKIGTPLFFTVAVVLSLVCKEYLVGIVALLFILIAEYISIISVTFARSSIEKLQDTLPSAVVVKHKGQKRKVSIIDLRAGDIVLLKTGETVPVDGEIVGGGGAINEAAITGDSACKIKTSGAKVYAGTFMNAGSLDIEATKVGSDTIFSRVHALVSDAESKQLPIKNLTDRIAVWLGPAILICVGVVYVMTRDIQLVISLLILGSPAQLGLGIGVVKIAAISRALREGILFKGGNFLEELARVDTFVFDKAGTLTVGKPRVSRLQIVDSKFSEEQLIRLAAAADSGCDHPIAKAILSYAGERAIAYPPASDFYVVKGRGVAARVDEQAVLIGNRSFMNDKSVSGFLATVNSTETAIFIAINYKLAGIFYVSDAIRDGASELIKLLNDIGIERVIMLTGDNPETARFVSRQIGISEHRANLLPGDKVSIIHELQESGAIVAMVGDSLHDAAALKNANVGISIGAIEMQAAMEGAGVVLMKDKLQGVFKAITISKRSINTIYQNMIVCVALLHIVGILLVLMKIVGPMEAAAVHLLAVALVCLNSIKLLRMKVS